MTAAAFAEFVQPHPSANRPPASFHPNEIIAARAPLTSWEAKDAGPETAAMLSTSDVIADAERFIRRFCVLPEAAYLPLAIWAVATHVPDAFEAFPYIALLSPAKRCGKTRLLEVLELLCGNPKRVTTVSPASLYRMMEEMPTLLMDEVEALGSKRPPETAQAVLAILNAGHRKGNTVTRCEPPNWEVRHFKVYGPKAFAAIGGLPDTLADRSICVNMQRKTEAQRVDRFLSARAGADARPLSEYLQEWARRNTGAVRATYERMPDLGFLVDRDADLWMPLFAVCAVVAPGRTEELKRCSLTLTGAKAADDVEDSLTLKLLADVRSVWPAAVDRVPTSELLEPLTAIADAPWSSPELTARTLAKMLRPFGVEARQIRTGDATCKGYLRAQMDEAFARYLPPVGSDPKHGKQPL